MRAEDDVEAETKARPPDEPCRCSAGGCVSLLLDCSLGEVRALLQRLRVRAVMRVYRRFP